LPLCEGREEAIAAVFATQRKDKLREGREVVIAAVFATQREEKLRERAGR
jgi:hypothetical protein